MLDQDQLKVVEVVLRSCHSLLRGSREATSSLIYTVSVFFSHKPFRSQQTLETIARSLSFYKPCLRASTSSAGTTNPFSQKPLTLYKFRWNLSTSPSSVGLASDLNRPPAIDRHLLYLPKPCSRAGGGRLQALRRGSEGGSRNDLSGLGLSGSMGYQLSNLTSVTYFDLSDNNLRNDIPYQLPPNAVHIDLSKNSFTGSVPYSLSQMKDLEYLNIGHNQLSGQLGDMFVQLSKLKELDLSFNRLSGNLPQSFRNLTSLTKLYLQNNKFSGSVNPLADLSLNHLNAANNEFTGWIPDELKDINNIEAGGNSWSSGPAPRPPPGQKSDPHARKSLSKGYERATFPDSRLCIYSSMEKCSYGA